VQVCFRLIIYFDLALGRDGLPCRPHQSWCIFLLGKCKVGEHFFPELYRSLNYCRCSSLAPPNWLNFLRLCSCFLPRSTLQIHQASKLLHAILIQSSHIESSLGNQPQGILIGILLRPRTLWSCAVTTSESAFASFNGFEGLRRVRRRLDCCGIYALKL